MTTRQRPDHPSTDARAALSEVEGRKSARRYSGAAASRRGLAFALTAILAAALGLSPSPTAAPLATTSALGVIRGRVEVRRPPAAAARRPTVSSLGAPPVALSADTAPSVVYLETAPRGAFEQIEPGRAVMDQRNETFVPHVLAVTAGTVVEFPNSDRIYHNVFSLSKVARFDLGRYEAGRSQSVRFDRPGVVRVFCEIHSHMNAFVLVFSHPFYAMTDADGRYRIGNVPPGTYSLIAWNEGVSSAPQPVTVPDGGTTEVDFTLR